MKTSLTKFRQDMLTKESGGCASGGRRTESPATLLKGSRGERRMSLEGTSGAAGGDGVASFLLRKGFIGGISPK